MTDPQAFLRRGANSAPPRRLRARQWLGLLIVAAGLLVGIVTKLLDTTLE